jgi:general secretion pathway protein F
MSIGSPRLSLKDQAFFAKRLAFLINAGVTLVESFTMLRDQGRGKSQKKVFDSVLGDIAAGQSLSRSFGRFPKAFGDFTISIVKIGESSGTLAMSLAYLAEELKKKQALRRKLVGAFVYPGLIALATLGITAFLMLYLFPKIMPVFASLHTELPVSTRIVMGLSVFLQQWGFLVIPGFIAVPIIFFLACKHNRVFHTWVDRTVLRVPVAGAIIQYYNVANSTRTLGLLLKSGITLSGAIQITAETTRNLAYKREYAELVAVVNRGERISSYLAKRRAMFPDVISHMIAVGERSGTLSETLAYLSELYEHEVDEFTKNLSTLIEPALMIVMGIIVGFIAISIITPIYGITQNLHG